MDRILLPVDFSERSVGAAHWARSLACRFGSELTLLHVLVPPQCEFGSVDVAGAMLAELCQDRAEQATRELETFLAADLAGLRVRRVVLEGDPAATIVDFAHERAHQPDRHAHPRIRPLPPLHPGIHHRQGAA